MTKQDEQATEAEHQLPPTSDKLLRKVRELGAMEMEKRKEPISSPRFHELASDVTRKSREIMFSAVDEEQVGDETERTDQTMEDIASEDQRAG